MENKGNRYLECFHNICDYCARQIRSCPYCRHQFSQAFLISIEITSERSNDHSSVIPSNTTERSNDHSSVLAENSS